MQRGEIKKGTEMFSIHIPISYSECKHCFKHVLIKFLKHSNYNIKGEKKKKQEKDTLQWMVHSMSGLLETWNIPGSDDHHLSSPRPRKGLTVTLSTEFSDQGAEGRQMCACSPWKSLLSQPPARVPGAADSLEESMEHWEGPDAKGRGLKGEIRSQLARKPNRKC